MYSNSAAVFVVLTCLGIAQVSHGMDLVSPSTCQTASRYLRKCAIQKQTLSTVAQETAVPIRTRIVRKKEGNCATTYNLKLKVTFDGEAPQLYEYILNGTANLRRADGKAVGSILIEDGSEWTGRALFDSTCRISIEVFPNEIDVDSTEQAHSIINDYSQRVSTKSAEMEQYGKLVKYIEAFGFMKALTEYFEKQMTSDALQQFRTRVQEIYPTLKTIAEEKLASEMDVAIMLRNFIDSLSVVDNPEAWVVKIDETHTRLKTLKEFWMDTINNDPALNPDEKAVKVKKADHCFQIIDELGKSYNASDQTSAAQAFEQAAKEVVQLQYKLDLASYQLRNLL